MKIIIKSEQSNFTIILPTALILNRLSFFIATKIVKNKFPLTEISAKDSYKFIYAIKSYKRHHKHWEIVNITSASGDIVCITL